MTPEGVYGTPRGGNQEQGPEGGNHITCGEKHRSLALLDVTVEQRSRTKPGWKPANYSYRAGELKLRKAGTGCEGLFKIRE
jgi:hypothetical protein